MRRYIAATTGMGSRYGAPILHALDTSIVTQAAKTKAPCGVRIRFPEFNHPFTHLHARACPKCVKIVNAEGGLK